MYVKTHGDFAPGEQRRRGYDWQASGRGLHSSTSQLNLSRFEYNNTPSTHLKTPRKHLLNTP